jgi:hypothetical protein
MSAAAEPPEKRDATDVMLHRIERLNYLFGGVLVIAVAIFAKTRSQALGAAVGVALTCINFAVLRRLVFKWTASVKAGDERGGTRIYLILPKMIGLMGAVVLALWLLPVDAIFFVAGYSVFIISIVVAGAMAGMGGGGGGDDSTPSS